MPIKVDETIDCTCSRVSCDTLNVRTIIEIEGQKTVELEEWIRLHVKPKPKRMSETRYRKLISSLLHLERFSEVPNADQG